MISHTYDVPCFRHGAVAERVLTLQTQALLSSEIVRNIVRCTPGLVVLCLVFFLFGLRMDLI